MEKFPLNDEIVAGYKERIMKATNIISGLLPLAYFSKRIKPKKED
jgi:hypothetical protein